MNKTTKKSRTFRFRRFCRGKFATFQSLHKEVSIGRLANYIADKKLKKSKAVQSFATTAMLVCAPFSISADSEISNVPRLAMGCSFETEKVRITVFFPTDEK